MKKKERKKGKERESRRERENARGPKEGSEPLGVSIRCTLLDHLQIFAVSPCLALALLERAHMYPATSASRSRQKKQRERAL